MDLQSEKLDQSLQDLKAAKENLKAEDLGQSLQNLRAANEKLKQAINVANDNKCISAAQARELTDHPAALIKRLFKIIKEAANEGMVRTTYALANTSGNCLNTINTSLKRCGFKVEFKAQGYPITSFNKDFEIVEIIISW